MATVQIGGDDSVAWSVEHDGPLSREENRPRRTLHQTHPNDNAYNVRGNERYLEGRDPKNTDGRSFTITIRVPSIASDKQAFAIALRKAADDADAAPAVGPGGGPGTTVSFPLPIEPRMYEQIKVVW